MRKFSAVVGFYTNTTQLSSSGYRYQGVDEYFLNVGRVVVAQLLDIA